MRSEREIREKIERYLLRIDMLLWMLEDESGLPPLDERTEDGESKCETCANYGKCYICGDCNEGSEYKKETRL